ncbi:DNA adenine methylase [Treponema sp.]|uniref:DNA adenine methylase n=1 Tax=Treponema sp. TaxID=166 RepID=UPI003F10C33B
MTENIDYLTSQIITYIGNKRALINSIRPEVEEIRSRLKKQKLVCADLFSGSGIVARMLKQYSSTLIVNDLEEYSSVLNSCYLFNKKDFDSEAYFGYRKSIEKEFFEKKIPGIICRNYAPASTEDIQPGERTFYTRENAERIDSYRTLIDRIVDREEYRKFFIAPLLTEASVHVNTSGIFKGFYKDKRTGIGCFGGTARNALSRIMGRVELPVPVFSNFKSRFEIYQKDTSELCTQLKKIDVAYLDPPYNQHPYGSNYFMLNLIARNKMPDARLSKISGIPADWNHSVFNRRKSAFTSLEKIISSLDAKFIIISYNSEGFIKLEDMKSMLGKYGKNKTVEIPYNTFRGSRNLSARSIHVSEYLFILEKD